MILHLGGDFFVRTKKILMILDYEEAVANKDTSLFLQGLELEEPAPGRPKAIVVTDGKKAYLSPISPRTLLRRVDAGGDAPFAGTGLKRQEKEGSS